MANDLIKFTGDIENTGIDTYKPEFSPVIDLTEDTKNVSTGINFGLGVRYGMAPIPGQQHTEYATTGPVGIRQQEGTGNNFSYNRRLRVYGVIPITEVFPVDYASITPTDPQTYYVWIVGSSFAGIDRIDALISSVQSSTLTLPSPDIAAGENYAITSSITNTHQINEIAFYHLRTATADVAAEVEKLTKGYAKNYASFATISVSGSNIPMNWIGMTKLGAATATVSAIGNFHGPTTLSTSVFPKGMPSSINSGNYRKSRRNLVFYNLYTDGTYGPGLAYAYNYNENQITEISYFSSQNMDRSSSSMSPAAMTFTNREARDDATAVADAFVGEQGILLYDPELTTNTSHTIVMVAGKTPAAYVIQGWSRSIFGYPFQFVNMTDLWLKPRTGYTENMTAVGNQTYSEDGVTKSTCWAAWPIFSTAAPTTKASTFPRTTLANIAANSLIALGDADSGVLRADTTYEITYSIYDKMFGIESNVGVPAKIQTGTDDFVAFTMYRDIFVGGFFRQTNALGYNERPFRIFEDLGTPDLKTPPANYLEYRVYYRELGSYEWLPALFIDASKYLMYPEFGDGLWACQAPIASLPGGQPGGFVDYSELPPDDYECVLIFKNRTFWLSKKNLVFSLRDNQFAYPLRNSAPAPTGGYRGAIVHTYRGQSEQESRLVIFGGKETYIGKFTGDRSTMPIVISPDVTANYEVDGSDFDVQTWTSITAFSYRSAVVADGDLYWWGAQGIYLDNGVGNPEKISKDLEPFIFETYETSKTDEIHAVYNNKSKEIIWFYKPKSDSTVSHSIIYNTTTGKFFRQEFGSIIDWSQQVDTNNASTSQDTNGLRTLIGTRDNAAPTLQRAYFFDQVNRSGDLKPKTEFLIKQIAAGATSAQKVLTLATGYDATNFATIVAGDLIGIQQFRKYSQQTTGDDMIAKVVSTNTGAGTMTILMPEGAVLPNVVLTSKTFAPFWHKGMNGISWEIETNYWIPAGVNTFNIWEWLYLFFKYRTWFKIDPNVFDLAHKSPSSGDFISSEITFEDNSSENFQLYHALKQGDGNNQGQAIKLKLSGIHIGEEWVLQYLEAHTSEESGNILEMYQG